MARTTSIMLAGVGGQGTILASRVLAQLLLNEGHDVKMSEVHGMAQRGGSVTTHVRYGKDVDAPTIAQGRPISCSFLRPWKRQGLHTTSSREERS